jgi:predicted nucleic acid-binding protein
LTRWLTTRPRQTGCSNSVAEEPWLVIADASVAINLNATGRAMEILRALPFRVAVTDIVEAELREDRRSGRQDAALLAELVEAQRVRIVSLNDAALSVFGELVAGAAAETLDDGEAATIAYAVTHDAVPVIDERKARRICHQRFGGLHVLSTVELVMQPAVETALGRDALADAVFQALQSARMRVLPEYVGWVIALIGIDRALQCPSLPRGARFR